MEQQKFTQAPASSTSKKRDHADFQSAYRRSSNFRSVSKKERLEVAGNGAVKLKSEK